MTNPPYLKALLLADPEALVGFVRARIDEDEAAARATLIDVDGSGGWRADQQPVALTVDLYRVRDVNARPVVEEIRSLDDGDDPDDLREYVNGAAVAQHIARHDPNRTLRRVEAARYLLARFERKLKTYERHKANWMMFHADLAHEKETGTWEADYDPAAWHHSLSREEDYLVPMLSNFEALVQYEAAVYADHPDYLEEWKPRS